MLTRNEIASLRAEPTEAARISGLRIAYKAVVLLGTGWTVAATAEALLLDQDTVRAYAQKYQQGGIETLLTTWHKGSVPKLDSKQLESLDKQLQENIYTRVQDIARPKQYTSSVTMPGITVLD